MLVIEPAHHLATAAWFSIIQNELINIIGDLIHEQILDHVRESKLYSVIADEVTDSANKEQLSLVLRYHDPETGKIAEDQL